MNQIAVRINSSTLMRQPPLLRIGGGGCDVGVWPRNLNVWGLGQFRGPHAQTLGSEAGFDLILTWWDLIVNQILPLSMGKMTKSG